MRDALIRSVETSPRHRPQGGALAERIETVATRLHDTIAVQGPEVAGRIEAQGRDTRRPWRRPPAASRRISRPHCRPCATPSWGLSKPSPRNSTQSGGTLVERIAATATRLHETLTVQATWCRRSSRRAARNSQTNLVRAADCIADAFGARNRGAPQSLIGSVESATAAFDQRGGTLAERIEAVTARLRETLAAEGGAVSERIDASGRDAQAALALRRQRHRGDPSATGPAPCATTSCAASRASPRRSISTAERWPSASRSSRAVCTTPSRSRVRAGDGPGATGERVGDLVALRTREPARPWKALSPPSAGLRGPTAEAVASVRRSAEETTVALGAGTSEAAQALRRASASATGEL